MGDVFLMFVLVDSYFVLMDIDFVCFVESEMVVCKMIEFIGVGVIVLFYFDCCVVMDGVDFVIIVF